MLADIETADVDERMRPLLSYVGEVTREPARVSSADVRRVLNAGWDEHALHDAVSVCALFNFMNRFVSGLGVTAGEDYFDVSGTRLATTATRALRRCCETAEPARTKPAPPDVLPGGTGSSR